MLRTLTFRTKLLCTLAVPMAALLTLTAIVGRDRLDQADRAERLRSRIDVVAAALDVDHQVQREMAASANRGAPSDLTAARAATDAAAAKLTPILGGVAGGTTSYDHAAGRVRTDLKALAAARTDVDGAAPVATFAVPYGELASSLSDLVATIGDSADDPGLARQTVAIAALARVADATAIEWTTIDGAAARGSIGSGEAGAIRGAVDARVQWEAVYEGLATGAAKDELRALMIGDAINVSNGIEAAALRVTDGGALTADVAGWRKAMAGRLDLLHRAEGNALGALSSSASRVVDDAQGELRTFAAIAGGAIVLATILGLLLVRTITKPLRKLTKAARRLADEQLPALVEGLKTPGLEDQRFMKVAVEPIDIRSSDELGQLAKAFNAVQAVAVDVAAEQSELLRKGIGDIFVSLARRNQILIDRQIEFLDELEAAEDDPDQLSSLYRLDHLATRMRRNAESLLVLAGLEPTRRRSRPVALVDVVRAAIGETEDYARVELIGFEEVGVSGTGAVDLGHLLAELLENATHYSPPETKVTVEGRLARSGYVVSIVDQGIGMGAEQLADANALLASPPPVGLALGRSLGFTVVSRLAARHGVTVRLMPATGTGTAAVVHLPAHLIATSDGPIDVAPPAATAPLPTPPKGASLGPVFETVADTREAVRPEEADRPEPVSPPLYEPFVLTEPEPEPEPAPQREPEPEPVAEERRFTVLDDDEFEQAFQRAWGESAPDRSQPEPEVEPQPEPAVAVEPEIEPEIAAEAEPEPEVEADLEPQPGPEVVADAGGSDWGVDDEGWNDAAPEPPPIPWTDDDPATTALPRRQPKEPVVPAAHSLEDALPMGRDFDRGLADLMRGDDVLGPPALVEPPIEVPAALAPRVAEPRADTTNDTEADTPDEAAAEGVVEPAAALADETTAPAEPLAAAPLPAAPLTAAGLVRRVPRASEPPPADPATAGRPAIAANRRSPESVRAMLAQYRTGLQKGRSTSESEAGDE